MKRKVFIAVLIVLILFVSCEREDFKVNAIYQQPYITDKMQMGLSFYMDISSPSYEGLFLEIHDPSGNLMWNIEPNEVEYEGLVYYGSSDIRMPEGSILPTGTWTYVLVCKDGRKNEGSFKVNYSGIESVKKSIKNYSSSFYDSSFNIAVIYTK